MKTFLGALGLAICVALVASLAMYVSSRIVLPELGFRPLSYAVCFWATFWSILITALIHLLNSLIKEYRR